MSRRRRRVIVGGSGAPTEAPENTSVPVISGLLLAGSVLTCSTGIWDNSPTSYAYHLERDGVEISGSSGTTTSSSFTYTAVLADEGAAITSVVVASNDIGDSSPAESAAVTIISGLQAFFDAADTSTITATGGAVSQWGDKSGNAYHATQSTSATQYSTGTRTVNSLNVMDSALNDQMFLPAGLATAVGGANSCTVFGVAAKDTTSRTDAIFADQARFRLVIGSASAYFRFDAVQSASVAITADTNPHIMVGTREGNVAKGWYDGGTPGQNQAADTTLVQLRFSHADIDFDGALCEILLFNRVLTTAELNHVGGFLATKWGITWTNIV